MDRNTIDRRIQEASSVPIAIAGLGASQDLQFDNGVLTKASLILLFA
jgi:hypothetical protein